MPDWVKKIGSPAPPLVTKNELAGPIDTVKRALGAAPEPGKRYPIAPLPVPGEAEEQQRLNTVMEGVKRGQHLQDLPVRPGGTLTPLADTPWGQALLYAPGTPEFEREADRLWSEFDKDKMRLEGPKDHQTLARGLSKWQVRATLEKLHADRYPADNQSLGSTRSQRFLKQEEDMASRITDPAKREAFLAAIHDPNRPILDAQGTQPEGVIVPAIQAKGMVQDMEEHLANQREIGPFTPEHPRSSIDFADVDRQELIHQLGLQSQEASDLQRTVAHAMGVHPSWIRRDGTPKGPGWRGVWKSPDGYDVTEMSIGIQIGGIETEIPSIVPDTTDEECNAIAHGTIPDSALEKAQRFAEKRIKAGLSPFKEMSDKEMKARIYEQSKRSSGGSR